MITRGDAQSALDAFPGGAWAIRKHNVDASGAPASFPRSVIRPLPMFDGRHYCAADWHGFALAVFDFGTRDDVLAEVPHPSTTLFLDGAELLAKQQPWKRFLRFDDEAWITQWDVLSPAGSLAPGAHTLAYSYADDLGSDAATITFHVDAAGTGVCVG
jgi:hypothetical protein